MAGILNAELAFPQFPALDQYGQNTTLLLHGDGTNGAQNNTFLDSSTNNFTITRNGNTTQGTFSPFSQPNGYWSNYFNGSSSFTCSYLATAFGTGDFTLECWVYLPPPVAAGYTIVDTRAGATANPFVLQFNSSNYLYYYNGTSYTSSIAAPSNVWTHVAITRNSGTVRIFVNGQIGFSGTDTSNLTGTSTGSIVIGDIVQTGAYFSGYMSNLRIVLGTSVYTSAFTPPTSPLTAISGTSLLTFQSNRIVDNSANAFALSVRAGTPSVQAFHPISAPTSYFPSVNVGAGYFDGSGDYLTVPDSTALDLSGGAYTIEGWIYSNGNYSYYNTIIAKRIDVNPQTTAWEIYLRLSTGVLSFWNGTAYESSATPPSNSWSYFAAVYDGTNINLYLNGVRVLQSAITNTNVNATTKIGSYPVNAEHYSGYISNLRITKGAALYSGTTMTVPTAPLTTTVSSGSVSLLCNFTNAGIIDSVSQNALETVGNAQVSTTQSKFGGASISFNGSTDYLKLPYTAARFGTGDFTIECWVYITSYTNFNVILDTRASATANPFIFGITQTSGYLYYYNGTQYNTNQVIPLNQWIHVCISRSSGTIKMFVNGVQGYSAIDTSNLTGTSTSSVLLGDSIAGAGGYFAGYIDDFRITIGIGRYTQNFTPPQNALPDFGPLTNIPTVDPNFNNTTLLLHGNGTNGAQNNTFLDSSTNNFTITRNGNTTQGTFTPFSQPNGWWSNYFDQTTTSRLKFPSGNILPSSTDFTIECWIYPGVPSNAYNVGIIASQATTVSGDNGRTGFVIQTSGSVYFSIGESFALNINGRTVPFNQWTHVAVTRSGNTFTMYFNGSAVASASSSKTIDSGYFNVGTLWDGDGVGYLPYQGYISNLRVVGSVVYSSNFTPSTTPLTAISSTNILACQSNRFLDNSSNAYSPTVTGTPSVQNFYPFFPPLDYSTAAIGGSGYYDGAGDFLNTPTSGQFTAAGDFTVSCWFYLQSFGNSYYVVGGNWSAGTSDEWLIQIQNNGAIRFLTSADGTFSSAGVVSLNQWTYFTATRTGTTVTVQVNGTTVRTYTKSDTLGSATKSINIGQQPGNNWPWNGFIADFRLVSGSAVTTIPTTPATAISGTGLLLSCTNAAIFDNASKNDLETLGNAQISTTQSKFGGSSMYFNGTTDYLYNAFSQNLVFGTGDFTIEFWMYAINAFSQGALIDLKTPDNAGTGIDIATYQNTIAVTTAGTVYTQTAALISNNTWYHIAVVKSASSGIKAYVNGVQSGTPYTSSTNFSNGILRVGYGVNGYFNGYIDDLRITKGLARYNYNFTPPIAQFPNK